MQVENSEPLVSVIIPVYNRADKICAAVDSVLGQSYPNIELIVVDDGSTDNTAEVLKKYGSRVKVLRRENNGPAAARNHGASASKGEIIAFLDSDDVYLPGKIERQVKVLQKAGEKVPCCLSNAIMVSPDGGHKTSFEHAPIRPVLDEGLIVNLTELLVTRFVLFNQTIAIRRWAWEKVGGYDESLTYMEDHELALQLSQLGPWAFIKEPLVTYRLNGSDALSVLAEKQQSVLQRDHIRIYQNMERQGKLADKKLSRHIRSNLCRSRHLLEISSGRGGLRSWICRIMLGWEIFKVKVSRKMPWFPRIKERQLTTLDKENLTVCRA